jgi:hypothetical protein
MSRSRRPVVLGLLATLLAFGLAAAPPAAREVRAATPDLTLVGDARYDVQPANGRIRVTVDLVATNHLQDTATKRFYFDRAFLQIQPGTTGFRLSSSSGSPSVRATKVTADYTILRLTFGRQIFSGKSASFQLRFDLPDPGGRAARDVRVGSSLVSFPAWGFGTPSTPGGSVTVAFPSGYTIQVFGGGFSAPKTGPGATVTYASGRLADPATFSAFFLADRPASYVESTASPMVGGAEAPLTIRSWSDDPAWGRRVKALFERGLPVIGRVVGLPWTRTGPLVVQETVCRTTGGYAGLFDPSAGRIEVAYYADSFVILHEAAHSWFNGALLADRWANEAFASYYALVAAGELKEKATAEPLTAELRKARIPLNDWGAVGAETGTSEDYAYAASLTLATEIGKRAGPDGLREVWAAAAAHEGAYQPAGGASASGAAVSGAETVDGSPDWRGLLDLFEDKTGKRFDDLWRQWVVRDAEKPLLDERATARAAYTKLVADAGPWQLPGVIRGAMRSWQFDDATQLMAGARAVLARRIDLEGAAVAATLTLPNRLETAFESSDGVAAANAEADAELSTIEAIVAARAARPASPGAMEQLGLLGASPEGQLAEARAAFSRGDLSAAARGAASARSAWSRAGDAGLNRALAAAATILLILLGLIVLASSRRDARRRGALERRGAGL